MLTRNIVINNDIQAIVEAIVNKNKLEFRHSRKGLYKIAKEIVPSYRDFILKIIKSGSIKIKANYRDGFIIGTKAASKEKGLSKRQTSEINNYMVDLECLPHEIGHACDFWFGTNLALTSTVLINETQTLKDIFLEEFSAKQYELYSLVMKEFKAIIDGTLYDGAYALIKSEFPLYRDLLELPINTDEEDINKARKRIQRKLYKSGFVDTYYQFVMKKCYATLNNKYSPILDALSSRFDLSGYFLHHHEYSYYYGNDNLIAEEFFANVFAAKVTGKHHYFDYLIKYLPRSFNAFEKLFVIFYDRIQNNKRFTDVKIKKEIN